MMYTFMRFTKAKRAPGQGRMLIWTVYAINKLELCIREILLSVGVPICVHQKAKKCVSHL